MAMHMYEDEDGNLNLTTGEAILQFLMIFWLPIALVLGLILTIIGY